MSLFTSKQITYFRAHQYDDRKANLIATVATCLVISYAAVVLRVICRRLTKAPLATDDWLIVAAQVAMTSMHISIAVAVSCGFGVHIMFASNLVGFAKSVIAIETSYSVAVILTKLSILALYRRIFPFRAVTMWARVIGAVVVLYSAALVVVTFTTCIPLHKLWDPSANGSCMNTSIPFTVLAIINVVTDASILCLPVKYVWNLQMNQMRKYSVLGIFLLGSIVCIFGVVRCTVVGEANTIDPTWSNINGGIWSALELSVGIVCACLPTFGPLFSKVLPITKTSKVRDASELSSERHSPKNISHPESEGMQLSSKAGPPDAWSRKESGDEFSEDKPFAATAFRTDRAHDFPHHGIRVEREVSVY